MPPRSTVYTLDEPVRAALDRRIAAAGFGRYADHAAWLAAQGYAISEAAIQRYGKRLRRSAERDSARASEMAAGAIARIRHSTEMARAINEAAGDDPLALSARAAELCLVRLYEIAASEDIDARTLQAVSRSLNESLRAVTAIRSEREEVRKEALREARQRAGAEMKRRGLSADTAAAIRAAVAGVPDDFEERAEQEGLHPRTVATIRATFAPIPEPAATICTTVAPKPE